MEDPISTIDVVSDAEAERLAARIAALLGDLDEIERRIAVLEDDFDPRPTEARYPNKNNALKLNGDDGT